MGTRLRSTAIAGSMLATACSPLVAPHSITERAPATIHPRADELLIGAAMHDLPPLYFYFEQTTVHRPSPARVAARGFLGTDDIADAIVPDKGGLLVGDRVDAPALHPGDRLVVVHETGDTTELEVTQDRCSPNAPDCFDCGSHWARRIAGRSLERRAGAHAIVAAPRDERFSFAWSPTQPEFGTAVIVTDDGIQLREYMQGTNVVADYEHDGMVRRLPLTRRALASPEPQVFGVIAWPQTRILGFGAHDTIGGADLVVIGQWAPAPSVPIRDASYWILGRESVVGRLRFDPPYAATHCSFMSNPCWAMTPVELPRDGTTVIAIAGPIPDGAPEHAAVRVERDDDIRFVSVGPRKTPLLKVHVSTFACRSQDTDGSRPGLCSEVTYGASDRRVTFLATDVHHANPRVVCADDG